LRQLLTGQAPRIGREQRNEHECRHARHARILQGARKALDEAADRTFVTRARDPNLDAFQILGAGRIDEAVRIGRAVRFGVIAPRLRAFDVFLIVHKCMNVQYDGSTMNAIETVRLSKRYGATVALDSLDLAIRQGEVYGYLGPNGAGK